MSATSELVNASPPTDAPRSIHSHIATITIPSGPSTTSRILHTNTRVRDVTAPFSRAHWLRCEVVFVPCPSVVDCVMHITAAFTADDAAPSSKLALWQEPSCSFHVSGGTGVAPQIFTYPLNFNDVGTSTLVKPAPIELHRTAVAFHISVTKSDDGKLINSDKPEGYCDVFLRGQLSVGGRN